MNTQKVEGIIIRRTNSGEADRLLTVLTREHGKMQMKAKGVRRITSRRSSHVELLNLAQLGLYKGRGMPIVTEAVVVDNFSDIKADLKKIGYAYHVCEVLNGLCPENQEMAGIYDMTKKLFMDSFADDDVEDVVHEFEVRLLIMLGFWPEGRTLNKFQASYVIESVLERKLRSQRIFRDVS